MISKSTSGRKLFLFNLTWLSVWISKYFCPNISWVLHQQVRRCQRTIYYLGTSHPAFLSCPSITSEPGLRRSQRGKPMLSSPQLLTTSCCMVTFPCGTSGRGSQARQMVCPGKTLFPVWLIWGGLIVLLPQPSYLHNDQKRHSPTTDTTYKVSLLLPCCRDIQKLLCILTHRSKCCWLPIHNLIKLSSNSLSCIISVLFSATSDAKWKIAQRFRYDMQLGIHQQEEGNTNKHSPVCQSKVKWLSLYCYRRNKMYISLSENWKLLSKKSRLIKSWWTVTSHLNERTPITANPSVAGCQKTFLDFTHWGGGK